MLLFYLLHTILIYLSIASVNIRTQGSAWMCNIKPEQYGISALSNNDRKLINQLEQVQIFHRHGARVGSYPISSFLKNPDGLEYNCNITSVVTRQYKDNNYYKNASKPIQNIRKIYVENEQLVEGNCQRQQSLQDLIPQLEANAQHLLKAYIGDESYHIFDTTTLKDLAYSLIMNSEDNRISLQTTDKERTIASQTVLLSEFFNDAVKSLGMQNETLIINTNVWDLTSDPYHADDNEVCINQDEYKQWVDMWENDINISTDSIGL